MNHSASVNYVLTVVCVSFGSSTPCRHACGWAQVNWERNESVLEVISFTSFIQKICSFERHVHERHNTISHCAASFIQHVRSSFFHTQTSPGSTSRFCLLSLLNTVSHSAPSVHSAPTSPTSGRLCCHWCCTKQQQQWQQVRVANLLSLWLL